MQPVRSIKWKEGNNMGMPNIPDVSPAIDICREDTINLLLASVAFEELGLAHILNAEGEKIQCLTGDNCPCDAQDLLDINESVSDSLRNVIKTQMLLQFKLEDILKLID